ncbi:hypothetical protein ACLESO_45735 [Pyxidicoccus sp. 3LG]
MELAPFTGRTSGHGLVRRAGLMGRRQDGSDMQTENRSEYLGNVEKAVSGNLVEAGPDHLVIHDIGAAEDVTVRIDDRTRFVWHEERHDGQLTDTAQVRVGYYIAGGLHTASEVIVLDPGDGESIVDILPRRIH